MAQSKCNIKGTSREILRLRSVQIDFAVAACKYAAQNTPGRIGTYQEGTDRNIDVC